MRDAGWATGISSALVFPSIMRYPRMLFSVAARKACASSKFVASSENSSESVSMRHVREKERQRGAEDMTP